MTLVSEIRTMLKMADCGCGGNDARTPYEEGWTAAETGKSISACPYQGGEAITWRNGFNDFMLFIVNGDARSTNSSVDKAIAALDAFAYMRVRADSIRPGQVVYLLSYNQWSMVRSAKPVRLKDQDAIQIETDLDTRTWQPQVMLKVKDSAGGGTADNDPPVVRSGTPERGITIPPPKDPKERAAWEAGVARRKHEGRGPFVGDGLAKTMLRVQKATDALPGAKA